MSVHFVHPGEVYFGSGEGRVRTILGSCVAFVLWHPARRLGGMCHFVLPEHLGAPDGLNGRYADDALALLARSAERAGTRLTDYRAWAFGGGNMFPGYTSHQPLVGDRNVEAARRLVSTYGLSLQGADLGGTVYRSVTLDLASGAVTATPSNVANFQVRESA